MSVKKLNNLLPLQFHVLCIVLISFFTSCQMFEKELSSSEEGSVAFTVDDTLAGKIAAAAKKENLNARLASHRNVSRSQVRTTNSGNLFLDLAMYGDYEASQTIQVSSGSAATFDTVPVGASVYVEATAYYQENGSRRNLYKGHSKTFTVLKGENQVVFVLHRVSGSEEESGNGGGGNGSGSDPIVITNILPDNKIYIANAAAGGDSSNDGTEEHPLDSIQNALAKIHELVEDPNNTYDSGDDWAIVLLSNIEGAQTVTTDADSDVFRLYIASKEAADIKTINGGFTTVPADPYVNQTTLTIESQIRYIVLQCVKITGGYAGQGGGIVHRGWNLDIMPGVEIYGNKAVSKGAGVFVWSSSTNAAYLNIKGAVIRDNICASADGSGGGVYILGRQEGVDKRSLFTLESGSVTGNKADYGAGICAEGDCSVTIEGGSIASNSNYTNGAGAGGGIYLFKPTGNFKPRFEIKDGSITSNVSKEGGGIWASNAQLTFSGGTISGNTASSGKAQGLYAYSSDAASPSFMTWGGNISFGANDVVYLGNTAINVINDLTSAYIATIEPGTYTADNVILIDGSKNKDLNMESIFSRFSVKPKNDGTEWHLESKPYLSSNNTSTISGVLKQGAASGSGGGGTSGNVVNLYVNSLSGYGSDSNDGLSEDSALMTLGAAFDKMTDSTKDYVVNVMSKIWQDGLTSDYSQLEISSGVMAKSIKIIGTNTDSDERVITGQYDNEGPGTVMKVTSSVPVTIESITITGGCSDSDHKGGCIEIGSGATVILGNDTYIQGGMVNGGFGGGVYVSADSTFIMKGNSVVQADQYSAVYLEEGAKIMIGSNLTGRTSDSIPYVAQITPASYSSTTAKIGIVSGSGTSLAAEHDKFAVTSITQLVAIGQPATTINYIINESGMLEEVAGGSGGGGTNGIVVTSNAGGSGMASFLSDSEAVTIELRNENDTIDFTKLKIKIDDTEYASDSLRNFVTTGTTDNENSYEFSFGSSLTITGTVIEIYYNEIKIETLTVMRRTNTGQAVSSP